MKLPATGDYRRIASYRTGMCRLPVTSSLVESKPFQPGPVRYTLRPRVRRLSARFSRWSMQITTDKAACQTQTTAALCKQRRLVAARDATVDQRLRGRAPQAPARPT